MDKTDILRQSDSFCALLYPDDPELWNDHLGLADAFESWIRCDRQRPLASFITKEVNPSSQSVIHDLFQGCPFQKRTIYQKIMKE
jgi:hypothetical protein